MNEGRETAGEAFHKPIRAKSKPQPTCHCVDLLDTVPRSLAAILAEIGDYGCIFPYLLRSGAFPGQRFVPAPSIENQTQLTAC